MVMDNTPLTKNSLIQYIKEGYKNLDNLKLGLEFENFLFKGDDLSFVPYRADDNKSIEAILNDINKKDSNWLLIKEQNNIIGLHNKLLGDISLEPAGQLEYATAPLSNLNDMNKIINSYYNFILPTLQKHDIYLITLGYNPKFSNEDIPLMPKNRYKFMYAYMPKVGKLGQKMMKTTATLQANFDYVSEPDLIKKFKVATAMQPFMAALYANSPFVEGKPTNYASYRNYIWTDTDNNRAGLLEFVFSSDFNIESYINYALNVPMYFIYRNGNFIIPQNHIPFKDYMNGDYSINDEVPIIDDFELHLSTLFPDVRLKQYIEVRAADCPNINFYTSLGAIIIGIMYNKEALDNAYNLLQQFSYTDLKKIKNDVIFEGLNTKVKNTNIKSTLMELISFAEYGLNKRNLNEEIYLDSIKTLLSNGKSLSEIAVSDFNKFANMNDYLKNIALNKTL